MVAQIHTAGPCAPAAQACGATNVYGRLLFNKVWGPLSGLTQANE